MAVAFPPTYYTLSASDLLVRPPQSIWNLFLATFLDELQLSFQVNPAIGVVNFNDAGCS